jgi:uncharacterized protein (DUF2141 family)
LPPTEPETRHIALERFNEDVQRLQDFGWRGVQWGVSNNAGPSLRAPRFDEAVFKTGADAKEVVIDIKVAK